MEQLHQNPIKVTISWILRLNNLFKQLPDYRGVVGGGSICTGEVDLDSAVELQYVGGVERAGTGVARFLFSYHILPHAQREF